MAEKAHAGQKRISGEPYISHPIAVANYLSALNLDVATIAAGLLHDAIEDTPVTVEDIKKEFGADIAFLVEGTTKLKKIEYVYPPNGGETVRRTRDEHLDSLKKMLLKR